MCLDQVGMIETVGLDLCDFIRVFFYAWNSRSALVARNLPTAILIGSR